MASEEEEEAPKLSLFSLPTQLPEPPGMLTTPLHTRASVPFLWEEAPGKPRTTTTSTTTKNVSRCLELPPRLLSESKMTDAPSPTTVLDGPYVRRSASHSTLFARERLGSFEEMGSASKRRESSRGSSRYFNGGTWGRKSCKRNTRVCEDSCVISPCSSSLGEDVAVDDTKVKITRIRRTASFFSLSNSRNHHSHFLARIYATFKQVVPLPWRSRKIKKVGGHSF